MYKVLRFFLQVFYPLLEKMGKDGQALADESREDHKITKERVGEIDGLPFRDVAGKVVVAINELVEHMNKEEQNDLPLIRQKLSKEDLQEAASKFLAAKAFAPKSIGDSGTGTMAFKTPYDLLLAPIEKVQKMIQEKAKGGESAQDDDKPYNLRTGDELKHVVPFPEGPHDTLGLASHKDEKGQSSGKDEKGQSKGNEEDSKSGNKSGSQQHGGKSGGHDEKSGKNGQQGGKSEGQQQGGRVSGHEEKSDKVAHQQHGNKGEKNQSEKSTGGAGGDTEDGEKRYNLRTDEEIKHTVPFPEGPHDTLGLQSHKADKDGGKSGAQKDGDHEGSTKGKQSEDKSSHHDKSRGDKSQHTSPSKGNTHDEKSRSGRNSRNGDHQGDNDSSDQHKRGHEDDGGQGSRKKVAL